jgi:phage gpG-like protein
MLSVSVDTAVVERSLAELERRGQDLRQPLRIIRKEMRGDQRDHARSKEGPSGKWPARARETVRAARGKGRAKRFMGRLPSAVDYIAEQRRVVARSKVPWSGSHMEGDTVGKGVKLPARPFLWISDKLVEVAERVLTRFLVNGWGKR